MKVQRFSGFQSSFSFFYQNDFESFKNRFYESDLGKIYLAIPWQQLVKQFKLKEKTNGRDLLFPPQGRIALMFLKNYSRLSDSQIIEQLNGNIEWQFFCGIYLDQQRITNYKIISQIRCELAERLDIESLQKTLYSYWKPYIQEPEKIVMDATCYESEVRYPTDVKLLWESVEWSYQKMKDVCNRASVSQLRTKYLTWQARYVGYSKMRRKTKKKTKAIKRSSLRLIKKLTDFLLDYQVLLNDKELKRLRLIKKVYFQQKLLFEKGILPKNRVVSLHKEYLRPILRGKEIKAVEFGAKVNKFIVDGIGFIEHLSFDAFNEGTRFKHTIETAQVLTHRKVKVAGADAIYATNSNRKYATGKEIKTDFKPKGPRRSDYKLQKQMKAMITKERASRMEGSFGKDKEHYNLRKIKARTKKNEILWIFFGIHCGNALEIGRRKYRQSSIAA